MSLLAGTLVAVASSSLGQTPATDDARQTGGRVVLVMPFDNRSGQTPLEWIGDSFPDTLNQRLTSAGYFTISREDREFALEHLGLPTDFKPSRATMIRIAQNLDADFVVVGNFTVKDSRIAVEARVLEVKQLRLSQPLGDSAELQRLLDVENALSWKVARQMDPHFSVAQQTFLSASAGVRLSSFENYIRGTDATAPEEQVKRLQMAVGESPNYTAAILALGKAQYANRDYDKAAATFARIPVSDRRSLEGEFYLGLSRFNTAKYAEAEAAFAFVASRLPLPEVVNNQGVAASRRGRDATPLFLRAVSADPKDPDYHYNLAVTLLRRGDTAGTTREIDAALKLRPADNEAAELKNRIASGRGVGGGVAAGAADTSIQPTERIRRTYSEASFRQAAFQLDQMRTLRMASLSPGERAAQLTQLGREYMAQGLLPEAEGEFQAAITADGKSYLAHAGLAEVREKSGSPTDARTEAQTSLQIQPNVPAYMVLARMELQSNDISASAADVGRALKLEPTNSAALGMRQALQARGQAIP